MIGEAPDDRRPAALSGAIGRVVEERREETVRLLQDLVRVPSPVGEEGAVQEVVEGALRGCGLEVDRFEATQEEISPYKKHVGEQRVLSGRPNVVGVRKGGGGGRSLLLNSHVDTVRIGEPAFWTHGPLSGRVVGERLYGRGACDMKGGLASQISALAALGELGVGLAGDVTVAATVGEEDGGVGALATILRGYRADAALICEPTRLRLAPAQGGAIVFRLTVTGRATHAALRSRGVSALEKFVPLFEDLRALEKERDAAVGHPLFGGLADKAPINVGVVSSGNWPVTVPETLVAEVRIGHVPGEDVDALRSMVTERITAVAERDGWLREHPLQIVWTGGLTEPAEVPVDAPICETVKRAHERVTGEKPAVEGASYGADMRLFVLLAGMPCVMYGAGDAGVAHAPDEHVSIPELLTATKVLACLLADWCGTV